MGKKQQSKRLFLRGIITSDMHCGHKVGLTPPAWQHTPSDEAPHVVMKAAAERKRLWEFFASEVNALRPFDFHLNLGDSIDGRGERSGGVELLTSDRAEQIRMAADVFRFIGAKQNRLVRGTPYHTGTEEDWEDQIKRELAGSVEVQSIGNEGHYNIRGLRIACKHFIGNSATPLGKYTALARSQVRNLLWAALDQQPKADIIMRGHVHRYARVEDDFGTAVICPALQGLGSRFGARQCDGLPVSFGFMHLDVVDADHWELVPHVASLRLQGASEEEIG